MPYQTFFKFKEKLRPGKYLVLPKTNQLGLSFMHRMLSIILTKPKFLYL